nr:hypothetical protein [Xenorhabdus bovienii]
MENRRVVILIGNSLPLLVVSPGTIESCCTMNLSGRRVGQFTYPNKRIIYRWFNRKGGRRRLTREKLTLILKMLGYPSR